MTSDCAFFINRRSLCLLVYNHVFRLYDPAIHYQASFYKNVGMLKFKHNITLRQSKWRWCLKTYNSVLTLFVASLFFFVMHFTKIVRRSILKIYKTFNFNIFIVCAIIVFERYFPPLMRFLSVDVLLCMLPHPTHTYYLVLMKPITQTFCLPLSI